MITLKEYKEEVWMCKLCRDVIFEKGANLIVVEIKV
jgi:hypothetical protein